MAIDVTMPQMGADMTEGTLLRWLKHPGEHVDRGEVIAEIETDKANVEIESFEEGVLTETLADEGQVVPVGTPIARIGAAGEEAARQPSSAQAAAPAAAAPATSAAEAQPAAVSAPAAQVPEAVGAGGGRQRVSPVARNLAHELGINVESLQGSGPDGRIVRRDVEAAAQAAPTSRETPTAAQPSVGAAVNGAVSGAVSETLSPASTREVAAPAMRPAPQAVAPVAQERPAAVEAAVEPFSRMRQAIARRMAQSKREAPHYYVTAEVDMTDAMAFRSSLNQAAGEGAHVTVNDLIVKACAAVLLREPAFNASFAEQGLRHNERINICIGIALPDGLIAPAVLDVGTKSLGAIARETRDLGERARNGGLRPAELNEGTFTISNLGMFGIETLIPIIQPPQAAILGVGAVMDKPAVRDGQIVVRKLMMVALAADHRVTDGAEGAQFLAEVQKILEHPLTLAL